MVGVIQQRVDAAKQEEADVAKQEGADAPQWNVLVRAKVYTEIRALTEAEAKVKAEAKTLAKLKAKLAKYEAIIKTEIKALTKDKAKAMALTEVKAKAEAESESAVSMTTPLCDLATDCLRLSIHFFYPIQQCAQQIYHSALFLSPTLSPLRKSCLQRFINKQLSHVAVFSGAPDTWGLLLRTINIRPRHLTSIATFSQRIIAACENIVNIYDAVTFVLQQSLCAPEKVTKIQGSMDGSILFFAHSFSVTMWDVQTGGFIHTFTTRSKINDFAASKIDNHIACGLFDGSVTFWDTHTKKKGKVSGNSQPVVTIFWLSSQKLAVAAQSSVYICDISTCRIWGIVSTPGPVWGVVFADSYAHRQKLLVGISQPSEKVDQEPCILKFIEYSSLRISTPPIMFPGWELPPSTPPGGLMSPMLVGDNIACITLPSGVQLFNISSHNWTNNPPPLDAATSLDVSMNRNLVAHTKDSIQIFSLDVLGADKAHSDAHFSHIYPLGEKHITCLKADMSVTILELETLQELFPGNDTLPLGSLLTDQPPFTDTSAGHGPVAEPSVLAVVQAWQSGIPLPNQTEAADEDKALSGLSPNFTWVAAVYNSPRQELRVIGVRDGVTLAKVPLKLGNAGIKKVYNLTFDSETRFHLKVEEPGRHLHIPYDIIASPSGRYPYTITQGEPAPLSELRATPPFTLDANCEWVIDRESRKICWISPGNLRRGNGGHFWAGLSLVMLGGDGVVRKLTMKEPEC